MKNYCAVQLTQVDVQYPRPQRVDALDHNELNSLLVFARCLCCGKDELPHLLKLDRQLQWMLVHVIKCESTSVHVSSPRLVITFTIMICGWMWALVTAKFTTNTTWLRGNDQSLRAAHALVARRRHNWPFKCGWYGNLSGFITVTARQSQWDAAGKSVTNPELPGPPTSQIELHCILRCSHTRWLYNLHASTSKRRTAWQQQQQHAAADTWKKYTFRRILKEN